MTRSSFFFSYFARSVSFFRWRHVGLWRCRNLSVFYLANLWTTYGTFNIARITRSLNYITISLLHEERPTRNTRRRIIHDFRAGSRQKHAEHPAEMPRLSRKVASANQPAVRYGAHRVTIHKLPAYSLDTLYTAVPIYVMYIRVVRAFYRIVAGGCKLNPAEQSVSLAAGPTSQRRWYRLTTAGPGKKQCALEDTLRRLGSYGEREER